jgi:hypothetical protein
MTMTALLATTVYGRVTRRPFGPRREARRPSAAFSVAPSDYIPSGTADMWRSARRTFTR